MAELIHLGTPWDVDRHIVKEENKLVLVRFSKYESRLPQSWRLKRKRNREAVARARAEEGIAADASSNKRGGARTEGNEGSANDNGGDEDDDDGDAEDEDAFALPTSSSTAEGDENALETYGLTREAIRVREEHVRRCAQMDAILVEFAQLARKYCVVYAVDTEEVPEFDRLYDLDDPDETFAIMFFYQNRHIKVDLSTGNNNKVNFLVTLDELIQIADVAYKGGKEGKTVLVSELRFSNVSIKR